MKEINLSEEYNTDFYAWINHNATLLREDKFLEIDKDNLIEELECMGRGERRQLVNRIAVLLAHLLKWKFQPDFQSYSWKLMIGEQRHQTMQLLKESPSLKHKIEEKLDDAYEHAVLIAAKDSGLGKKTFPLECPFNLEECLNKEFFPDLFPD